MYQQLSLSQARMYRQLLGVCLGAVLLSGTVNALAPWIARIQSTQQIASASIAVPRASTVPQIPAPPADLPLVLSAYRPDIATANPRDLARKINAAWFGDQHWAALQSIWNRESGFNPSSLNRSSGACGIPQALPCSKISDHTTPGQITWGLKYIQSRYGNPTNAWRFWQIHHWY